MKLYRTNKAIQEAIDNRINQKLSKDSNCNNLPIGFACESYEQHSRWLLTSLLTSVALNKQAPFEIIKTHGIIANEDISGNH